MNGLDAIHEVNCYATEDTSQPEDVFAFTYMLTRWTDDTDPFTEDRGFWRLVTDLDQMTQV